MPLNAITKSTNLHIMKQISVLPGSLFKKYPINKFGLQYGLKSCDKFV